jgi:hypothetical protein
LAMRMVAHPSLVKMEDQSGPAVVLPLDYAVPLHLVFLLSGHVISGNGCKTNLDQHSKL